MRVRWEGTADEWALAGPVIGRGTEATIYPVSGRPGMAAKVFHTSTGERADKIAALLAAPPAARWAQGHPVLAWPVGRLVAASSPTTVVGYLMPRVARARPLTDFCDPVARRLACPLFHHGYLLRTARNLAAAVQVVHEAGYVVGDLTESNVLVSSQALVTLIGVDGFQVRGPGRTYRCRAPRPDYTPPELQGSSPSHVDRRPEHDAFGLAVLIFQVLMQGIHPFDGVGTQEASLVARIAAGHFAYSFDRDVPVRPAPHAPPWEVLAPELQELFWRCFDEGQTRPESRPTAAQWREALDEADGRLEACGKNAQHVFPRGLDRCTWCALAEAEGRDPFPSIQEVQAAQRDRVLARPLPPPGAPEPAPAPAAAAGSGLGRLGASVERRPWLVWLGVVAAATMAGLLWALSNAPESAEVSPPAAVQPPVSRPAPEARPAPPEPDPAEAARLDLAEYRQAQEKYRQALQACNQVVQEQRRGLKTPQDVTEAARAVQQAWDHLQQAKRRLHEKVYGPEPAPGK
jgi:DNA-binding helix-hairpin-helix protein with protein kinase domain